MYVTAANRAQSYIRRNDDDRVRGRVFYPKPLTAVFVGRFAKRPYRGGGPYGGVSVLGANLWFYCSGGAEDFAGGVYGSHAHVRFCGLDRDHGFEAFAGG